MDKARSKIEFPLLVRCVLIVILAVLCACSARAQEITYGWWVTATFTPRHTSIEGIPVRTLNERWARASLITPEDLPKQSHLPGEGVKEHGFSLTAQADFDGDGVVERAVVGVFETVSGETGEFLLILGRRRSGDPWSKRALFADTGSPGFSAVALENHRLLWVSCFECDSGCQVVYRRGRFQRRCYSCC